MTDTFKFTDTGGDTLEAYASPSGRCIIQIDPEHGPKGASVLLTDPQVNELANWLHSKQLGKAPRAEGHNQRVLDYLVEGNSPADLAILYVEALKRLAPAEHAELLVEVQA